MSPTEMDNEDYSDFDWDIQPDHVYEIDFRKKMVSEFKIDKHLAWAFFLRIEGAVSFAPQAEIAHKERPSEKTVKNIWVAVSSSVAKTLAEIQKADELLEYSVATSLGWQLIEQDQDSDPKLNREPEGNPP